jgi:hypothetical protein
MFGKGAREQVMKRLLLIVILALAGCDDTGSSSSKSLPPVIIIPGDTTAPDAPSDLDVEMLEVSACAPDHVADARIRLTWMDNADNEDGYRVWCGNLPIQDRGRDTIEAECYPITIDASDSVGFAVAAFNGDGVSDMIRMGFYSYELAGLCP